MDEEPIYFTKIPRTLHFQLCKELPNLEAVEDVEQETLLALWKSRDRFDPSRSSSINWIFRQARWQTDKYYNKYIKIRDYKWRYGYKYRGSYRSRILDKAIIEETLSRFPPEYKFIAVEVLSGKTLVDIARDHNLTTETVRCRLGRMVQFIKDYPDSKVVYNKTRHNLK